MTGGEWILQALLVVGLFLVLPAAFKLERALAGFRRDRASLEQSAQQLTDAIKDAEVAISRLREVSRGAGQRISDQVEHVDAALRDIDVKTGDLQLMMERAEALAGRLERSVRQKPGHDAGKGAAHAAADGSGQPRHRGSHAPQPRPAPAAAAPRDSAASIPPAAPPTAALAMRRALDTQPGGNSQAAPPARLLAEQRVLHAIRGRTERP